MAGDLGGSIGPAIVGKVCGKSDAVCGRQHPGRNGSGTYFSDRADPHAGDDEQDDGQKRKQVTRKEAPAGIGSRKNLRLASGSGKDPRLALGSRKNLALALDEQGNQWYTETKYSAGRCVMNETVKTMAEAVRKVTDFRPRIALTLGSGLGNFASCIRTECVIRYRDIPGFPVSTAPGHAGKLIFGWLDDVPLVCMQGRVHLYEGYTPEEVVRPGTLAMITDHISVLVRNPLIGPNDDEEGVRFPDMTHVYDPELCEVLRAAAKEESIPLKEGVYVQFTGPSYETPAEIRMVKSWGGTIAGMSTVVEAIAARHCGMRVCAVSLISNLAAGISKSPLSEEEVIAAGEAAGPRFERLVRKM